MTTPYLGWAAAIVNTSSHEELFMVDRHQFIDFLTAERSVLVQDADAGSAQIWGLAEHVLLRTLHLHMHEPRLTLDDQIVIGLTSSTCASSCNCCPSFQSSLARHNAGNAVICFWGMNFDGGWILDQDSVPLQSPDDIFLAFVGFDFESDPDSEEIVHGLYLVRFGCEPWHYD